MNVETLDLLDLDKIRRGCFHGDEYRVPCSIKELKEFGGLGTYSWNEDIGDYIRFTESSPIWDLILKMKS